MLLKTLLARLLMMMPLESLIVTVNSSVAESIVCVEEPHSVKSKGCSAWATGRNKNNPKRIAPPLPHFLISIMLRLLLLYREIGGGVEFATLGHKKGKIKKASKGNRNPLEASYRHLREETFHMALQKGRAFVDRLIGHRGKMATTTIKKYSSANG
jgi:hypothetical protein